MFLDEASPDEVVQPLKEDLLPTGLLKKPYTPPELIKIHALAISNNISGSADGDSASAHS
jgi:hypothetical protein